MRQDSSEKHLSRSKDLLLRSCWVTTTKWRASAVYEGESFFVVTLRLWSCHPREAHLALFPWHFSQQVNRFLFLQTFWYLLICLVLCFFGFVSCLFAKALNSLHFLQFTVFHFSYLTHQQLKIKHKQPHYQPSSFLLLGQNHIHWPIAGGQGTIWLMQTLMVSLSACLAIKQTFKQPCVPNKPWALTVLGVVFFKDHWVPLNIKLKSLDGKPLALMKCCWVRL